MHNGNDTLSDWFRLVGRTDSLTSMPTVVRVKVTPVNDQTPRVENNTGVDVWVGGTTKITRDILGATDLDSPEDKIAFSVSLNDRDSDPNCGYVSVRPRGQVPAHRFTMDDINRDKVVFNHKGEKNNYY